MRTPDEIKGLRRRRLLIVDDNIMDLYLLSSMFKDEYIIEKAMGGNSALMWLRYYGTDISAVLLDLMMPDMDGFAVLERMSADARMHSIPAIVVSADEDRESCLRAIRCGASDFITKPVDQDLLRIRVQSAISRVENERLRAENSYLEAQNSESIKLRTLLEGTKTVLIEYDGNKDAFYFDPTITRFLAGNWNQRQLWDILINDGLAGVEDAEKLRRLANEVLNDDSKHGDGLLMSLKTPNGEVHPFRVRVYGMGNEPDANNKLLLTLNDMTLAQE